MCAVAVSVDPSSGGPRGILLAAHPYDTLFCNGDSDWMWRATYTQRHWRPACDGRPTAAGRRSRLRFHDLRHAHRAWMDEGSCRRTAGV